jgi:hypothetical protein
MERPLIHIFGGIRHAHPNIRNELFKRQSMNG